MRARVKINPREKRHLNRNPPPCSSPYWLPNTETIVLSTNQNYRLNLSLVTAYRHDRQFALNIGWVDESLLYEFENNWNMNLNSKKKSTRVCVGLFFLLGGTEYGESFSWYVCKQGKPVRLCIASRPKSRIVVEILKSFSNSLLEKLIETEKK